MKTIKAKVDFSKENGKIRRLNGGNLGPALIHGNFNNDKLVDEFRTLEVPITRMHDCPLSNPGMRLVDIHQIFGNWKADAQNPDNYYFRQTDDYLRATRAAGSDIFFRLGISIEHTLNNYYAYPPEDYDKWADICINIIRHYNEGWADGHNWNIKYWEIWNEPDVTKQMWNASMHEYCKMYEVAAKKIKARFPNVKVGGPVLAWCDPGGSNPAGYAKSHEFLAYCRDHNVPLDFFSWHKYGQTLDIHVKNPDEVRAMVDQYGYKDAELHLNEWHYWFGFGGKSDTDMIDGLGGINSAAYATATLTVWQDTALTMGYFYTIGNLGNAWGAWGLRGRNKNYYALKAFAEVAHYENRVKSSTEDLNLQVLAGKNAEGKRALLVSSFKNGADKLELSLKDAKGVTFKVRKTDLENNDLESTVKVGANGKIVLEGAPEGQSVLYLLTEE